MCSKIADLPGRCYWVKENEILAGGYPYNPGIDNSDTLLKTLLRLGFTAFLDLTEEDELTHYLPVLKTLTDSPLFYRRFAIVDYSAPEEGLMPQIIEFINGQLQAERKLYIHCRGGIGRTGTVVACWLKSQGLDSERALQKLSELFSASNASRFCRSPEADEQIEFVRNFQISGNKGLKTDL